MEKENHKDVGQESERLDRGGRGAHGKVNIIKSVVTILQFFALVVLVVEVMGLAIVTRLEPGTDRTLIIAGMLVIIIALIVVVTYLAKKGLLTHQSDGADDNAVTGIVPNALPGIVSNATLAVVEDKNRIKIEGTYLAEGNPNEEVNINYLSNGLYQTKHKIWEGVGLFDGEFYYGIYSYNDKVRDNRGKFGAHIAKLRIGGGALNLHDMELGKRNFHEIELSNELIRNFREIEPANEPINIEYEYIWVKDING